MGHQGQGGGVALLPALGRSQRGTAAVYVHANGNEPREVLDQALGYWEQGFRHIRCQLGGYVGVGAGSASSAAGAFSDAGGSGSLFFDPGREAAPGCRSCSLRCAPGLPAEAELLYDIHERLAPVDAVRLAKALEPYRLFFLEDALAPEDIGYFRMLRGQCAVPLAMGELFVHPLEVEPLVTERLIDFVRVHVSTYGGITAALKLANLCAAFGVRTAWHGPRDVSPVGMAANVHLDLHAANFGIQEWSFRAPAEEDLFPGIPEVRAGAVNVNERPGWASRWTRSWPPASRVTMPPACAPSRVSPTVPAGRSDGLPQPAAPAPP